MSLAIERAGWMPRPRWAISALFLANGYVVGNWAPKIPELKTRLDIGEGVLGLMILVFGVGSLVLMPVIGGVIARDGSQRVLRLLALAMAPVLLILSVTPSLATTAIAMFCLGGFVGGMDVAMNANAVAVERGMRRAIMSSCHGFWSLGGLIGAASGGVLLARLGPIGHALVVMVVCLGLIALAWPNVLRDQPEAGAPKPRLELPRTALPWLIGLVALFYMIPEGAILDWGALYLRTELGASVETSGLAFAGFSATMALMRFSGDPIRDWLGGVRTLRISTLVSASGLILAGLASSPAVALAGFAIAGLGIANMVPIMFSAAGNMPGLPPGIGLSLVTFMGYAGMLFAPSVIGFMAAHTGLGPIFLGLPLLYLLAYPLSHHAAHADMADR
ncbi:MFS transporter [uncultured Amaricoccus sp.]|uniref:MFS transporter n=1 Tax=uncultured Amaricoccus sp. TaxID=339341 RepID=UPI00260446E8|nr:MFS transporter [uncultured Amaricoccus sp.]